MYDIAIIGLGPAGATIARLLDKSFRIIAIDKKETGNGNLFCKPCGGLLATDAQKALSKFHLTLPKKVLVDPQIFAVRTIDLKQNITRYYQRFYINLDRHKFDLWLISLIPEQVEIAAHASCTHLEEKDGGYKITYIQNQKTHTIKAKYVIGADGSGSIVRRKLFPKKTIRRYISVQQWFEEQHSTPFYSCIFDSDITDSYCWSISKDGYFILGGAFPRKTAKECYQLLKKKLQDRGFSLGKPLKTESCLVSMPQKYGDFYTGKGNAFLLGEAAGFISPSSLEGISYAIDSAYMLANILNEKKGNFSLTYKTKSFVTKAKLLAKYIKVPFMYHPLLRKIVMMCGINHIEVVNEK